jgi:Pectinacetylesterase
MIRRWVKAAMLSCIGLLPINCSSAGDGPERAVAPSATGGSAPALPPAPASAGGSTTSGAPAAAGSSALGGSAAVSPPTEGGEQLPSIPPPADPSDFLDLSPPRGEPFDPAQGTPLTPPPPPGWTWYSVPDTSCRDGSEAGLFIRFTDSNRLLIFFEGGGACTSAGFCNFNPANVNQVLSGTGETVLGSAAGAVAGRQQPGAYQNGEVTGIFSADRSENPFREWNMVYVPYCTGDVHSGTRQAASVPGVGTPQMFVGHHNTQTFIGRLVPTFEAGLERVVVTGSSAGSFGAALNFSMISDAFGVQTDAILDSGVPFDDEFWPTCLQKSWRDLFGLNDALPPDCEQCFDDDGGGLLGMTDFLIAKHPTAHIALVSSLHDEVIRLFFTPGLDNCATITTADPVGITLGQLAGGQLFPTATYESGLLGVRAKYAGQGRMSSYFMAGANETLHQHSWRPRFFQVGAGSQSLAAFVSGFLDGRMEQVGP